MQLRYRSSVWSVDDFTFHVIVPGASPVTVMSPAHSSSARVTRSSVVIAPLMDVIL